MKTKYTLLILLVISLSNTSYSRECSLSVGKIILKPSAEILIPPECRQVQKPSATVYLKSKGMAYTPALLVDNNIKTGWAFSKEDIKKHQVVVVLPNFSNPYTPLKIFNGYGKSKNLHRANGRLKIINIHVAIKQENKYRIIATKIVELKDKFGYQNIRPFNSNEINMNKGIDFSNEKMVLILEVLEVTNGEKYNDVLISDIRVIPPPKVIKKHCPIQMKDCLPLHLRTYKCDTILTWRDEIKISLKNPSYYSTELIEGPCCLPANVESNKETAAMASGNKLILGKKHINFADKNSLVVGHPTKRLLVFNKKNKTFIDFKYLSGLDLEKLRIVSQNKLAWIVSKSGDCVIASSDPKTNFKYLKECKASQLIKVNKEHIPNEINNLIKELSGIQIVIYTSTTNPNLFLVSFEIAAC